MRASRRIAPIVLAGIVLCGCGKKGPSLPPIPKGPMPPTLVEARQSGAAIEVSFVVPNPRGDNPMQTPERAELVRVEYPPGPTPPSDADAFRRRGEVVGAADVSAVASGSRLGIADGSPSLADGGRTGWTLRYGVRVLDRRGRTSPLVVAHDIVPVVPPIPPSLLSAEATSDGVHLTWQAPPAEGQQRYNVYRARAGEAMGPRPLQREPLSSPEYLDAEVTSGTEYEYEVRTAATDALPLQESAPSAIVRVRAEDLFPPARPEKLVAVQEGATVRLFWNPNQERDLAGYRVYRAVAGGSFERVGGDAIERASFIDADVHPGLRVSYRVTAVDRATPPNESAPSEVAELEVATDPTAGGSASPVNP